MPCYEFFCLNCKKLFSRILSLVGRNVDRSTGMRSTGTQRFLKLKAER
jgi:hypothetical protein